MLPEPLTAAEACLVLRELGITVDQGDVRIESRGERWAVHLPDDRLAWFPASELGRSKLATERRVLRVLEARCSFPVPRVIAESDAGVDVRKLVPGVTRPWDIYGLIQTDTASRDAIGRAVGEILAEQHVRVREVEVAGWLPLVPGWPEPTPTLRARVRRVIPGELELIGAIDDLLDVYDAVRVDAAERALVHGDLGLHNIALAPTTFEVRGVFDYDDGAWADRHHDFQYLLFDFGREEMLDAALEAYEPAVARWEAVEGCPQARRPIDRARVRLYNAACAVSFLAYRDGVSAETKWCGRTLVEDLRWTRMAIARAQAG